MKNKALKKELAESKSIKLDNLDPIQKRYIRFININRVKFLDLFDGIHGKILMVNTKFSGHMDVKEANELSKILTNITKLQNFRWVAIDADVNGTKTTRISIGL